jgi:hypothetical protein
VLEDDALIVFGAVVRLGPLSDEAAKVIVGDDRTGIEAGKEAPIGLGVGEPAPAPGRCGCVWTSSSRSALKPLNCRRR